MRASQSRKRLRAGSSVSVERPIARPSSTSHLRTTTAFASEAIPSSRPTGHCVEGVDRLVESQDGSTCSSRSRRLPAARVVEVPRANTYGADSVNDVCGYRLAIAWRPAAPLHPTASYTKLAVSMRRRCRALCCRHFLCRASPAHKNLARPLKPRQLHLRSHGLRASLDEPIELRFAVLAASQSFPSAVMVARSSFRAWSSVQAWITERPESRSPVTMSPT
jgi:hypothetical protein